MLQDVLHVNFKLLTPAEYPYTPRGDGPMYEFQVLEQWTRNTDEEGGSVLIASHKTKNFEVKSDHCPEVCMGEISTLFVRGCDNEDDSEIHTDVFQVKERYNQTLEEFLKLFIETMEHEGYKRVISNKMGEMEYRFEK